MMSTIDTIRGAAVAISGFIALTIAGSLISHNMRNLAAAKGWDTWFLWVWDHMPTSWQGWLRMWPSLRSWWWLWLSFGLSGGLAIALSLLAGQSDFRTGNANDRPVGSTTSIQLAQVFHKLPQPCRIKLTDSSKSELGGVIRWVVEYGNIPTGPICKLQETNPVADADKPRPLSLSTEPGITVHWKAVNPQGELIAQFFNSMGAYVRNSHQLDSDDPDDLIWIDIGPGSPWK